MVNGVIAGLVSVTAGLFAVAPTSTNYTLKAFDFGNGGGSGSSSSYNLNGTTGIQNGLVQSSSTYGLNPGEAPTQDANVPPAAVLSNPNNTYNKLRLVINSGSNPSDTKFAIAISPDNFSTTRYVQNDNSIGTVLGIEDHQTYAAWGGASGFDILGLTPNTTYKVRVSALQGNFSGSKFGPESAGVATVLPSITFSVTTTATGTPPFNVSFASLSPNSVFAANADVLIGLTSNAVYGGSVYVRGTNTGLLSSSKTFTLASASADLGSASTGYGGQVTAVSQASGGPVSSVAPYNGTSDIVGILNSSMQEILSMSTPVTMGSATVRFKAKSSNNTPAATDYSDRVTFIAAMLF